MEQTTRIAVVGAGSVGGFVAAHLSGSAHDTIACVRRPFTDWLVESEEAPFSGPATMATSPDGVGWDGPADWVLVGVKAHQSAGAQPWFDRLCGPSTTVVAMQNGVEEVERLTPLVHGAHVLPTVVYCGTELLAPGHIKHERSSSLVVPNTDQGRALQQLFADTPGMAIKPDDEFVTKAWVKLGINVAANGLTALTGQPMNVLATQPLLGTAVDLIRECWLVGNAEGASLRTEELDKLVTSLAVANARTSMLQDVEHGRPTEHDALHGAVVRLGRKHGIATPVHDVVHSVLEARSQALAS